MQILVHYFVTDTDIQYCKLTYSTTVAHAHTYTLPVQVVHHTYTCSYSLAHVLCHTSYYCSK